MIKLLICLLSAAALAGVALQLRQQRLELAYETADLHDRIRGQQARLWNQQLLIAACTAPNAIGHAVDAQGLNLVPQVRTTQAAPTGTASATRKARSSREPHPAPPHRTAR